MSKQGKSRKPLIVGIAAAVVVLAVLLVLLLTNCTGGQSAGSNQTTGPADYVPENADLYWNVDRAEYDGMSEGGMSSRRTESDGYFHIRFFKDGKMVELRTEEKALVNKIDAQDIMGLVFDENGVIIDMIPIERMPVEKVGWKFYVQSIGGNIIKVNSSNKFNGLEVLLEKGPDTKVYDMTGTSGAVGVEAEAVLNDRVMAVADLEGNLLAVYIYDRSNMVVEFQAYCQHCDQEVTWIEWNNAKQLPKEGGHFQLVTDIQLNAQQNIKADAKICLDLNGHTVDGKEDTRVYSMHNLNCELAIMDTSEEQTGKLAGHGEVYAQGAVLWVRHGAAYMYSGTLDASDVVCTGRGGAALYVPKECFFYMHGGEIIGGTAKYYLNEETGKYANGLGGSVYILGKFVLLDGMIRDGVAQSIAVYSNGKTSYQRGIGGNIYVGSGGVFEMNGGTVKNGKAGAAGNVFLDGTAEFTMNGGVISGGHAVDPGRQGGNLNVGAKATFVMNGGTISYGTTRGTSGNVYLSGAYNMNGGLITAGRVLDSNTGKVKEGHASGNLYIANGAKFDMYGGTIHGGVSATDSSTTDGKRTSMVLSGLATIYGAEEGSPNLTLYAGKEPVRLVVGVLQDRAKVGITASGKFSLETKQSNQDNFYSDIPEAEVLYVDNCLALGKLACLCGSTTGSHLGACDGAEQLWAPWTTTNGLPGTDGRYYLVTDVAYTRSKSLGGADAFCKIDLDLNGHSIVSQQRVFTLYGTMNLVDHKGNGQIIGAGMEAGNNHSGAVLVYLDSELNIYGGALKLADKHYNITNAGVMAVGAGATVTMYGGSVDARSLDATGKDTDTTGTVADGGAIRLHGTMNVLGGTIYGGKANRGGAFFVEKNGALNISAGTVYGGATEQGGVVYVTGKTASVNISGGTLEGGTSTKDGGSIRLLGSATVNISGGTIRGGVANGSGGNIGVASGVLNISGGQLLNGKATATGGNINATGGTVNISGGQISGGEARESADNHSANIMVRDAALNLSGGTIAGSVLVQNTSEESKTALTLSGAPVVTRPGTYGLRLYGNNAAEPDLNIQGTLGEKASIEIDATDVFSTKTVAANEDKFVPADDLDVIHFGDDECLFVGRVHCKCETGTANWCDHKDVRWSKWNGKTDLTEGNYYLTGDVNATSVPSIGEKGKNVNICLNGKTISAKIRAMLVFGNVSIFDHGEGKGTILGTGKEGDHSAVAVVRDGGVLNLYKGTLKLAENHNNLGNGGVISVAAGGTMNIYGGSVDASASLNSEKTIANGAAIRVSGTLNVLGGSVVGGKATEGGTISVQKGGSAVISGGTVGGGSATTGGTVSVEEGTLTVSGGTVSGGSAKNGGTVSVENGTLTVSGGTVSGGEASNEGGSIYANGGSITVSSGTVNGGTAKNGGAVILRDAKMTVSGGTLNGGEATGQGGNVYITGANALLTVSGGKLVGGTASDGGSIRQLGNSTVKISGGSVESGASTGVGGNISVASGLLEISGGSVLSGTAATTGGNINVVGGTLHISGGTVSGGEARDSADNHSANIMVRNTALVLSGGTVEGSVLVQNTNSEGTASVTLSGEPVVTRPGTYGLRLYGNGGPEPDVSIQGTLGEKASIEIDATDVFSTQTVAENEDKFIPADDLDVIHFGEDQCLFVGRVHCKCETGTANWCDHKQLRWSKWDGKTELTEGNYYLVADVTASSLLHIGETGKTVNICLNGKTITGPASADRIANIYGTVNIFDHSDQKGTLVGVGKETSHSAVAVVQKDAQLNLYGGTLKLADNHRALTNMGGVVSVIGGGELNVFGGCIDASASLTSASTIGAGGAVRVSGTLNLLGGKIIGGKVTGNGGAILAKSGSTVNITKGTVSGGEAGGVGNGIYTEANVTLSVSSGTVDSIAVDNGNVMQLSGDPAIGALELLNGAKVQILSALTGEAGSIALSGVEGRFATGAAESDEEKFATGSTELVVQMLGSSELAVGRMRCLCGTGTESWCGEHQKTFWRPWEADGTVVSGNYYLTDDLDIEEAYLLQGVDVNLDLMGCDITAESRAFRLTSNTQLNILDSKGEAVVSSKGESSKNAGGVIHVNGAKLNIYSGTYQLAAEHHAITEGGVIVVGGSTSVVNISGGTIGGETTSGTVDLGGAIRLGGGTLTISGNAVINGHGATANGGAIGVKGGTLNITGGTINGGTVTGLGSAIYQSAGSVIISNGTVANGDVYTKDSALTVSGGTVSQITLANSKDAITASLKLSGAPDIDAVSLVGLDGKAAPIITVTGELTCADGSIALTGLGEGVYANSTVQSNAAKFVDSSNIYASVFHQDQLRLAKVRCLCGAAEGLNTAYDSVAHKTWCDATVGMTPWLPWDGTTALTDGNYYLTKTVTDGAIQKLSGETVNLDLMGLSYDATQRAFQLSNGTKLTIVNSTAQEGVITGKGLETKVDNGGVIHVNGAMLNIYSGTVKLASDHNDIKQGGVIVVGGATSVVNISGGTIGGTTTSGTVTEGGGAIRLGAGTLTISGTAQINGHSATTNGGAIYVTGGTLNVTGGTITGGKATNGGAIYQTAGTVNISENAIVNGSAVTGSGGAIYVEGGTLNVTGGTVNNGQVKVGSTDAAAGNGPTIYMAAGTVNLNGGTLGATTINSIGTRGGIVYVADGQLNIGGATINGATTTRAGSIWVDGGTVTMTSGKINGGKSTSGSGHGGSIYIGSGATFQLQGGTVQNGVSTKNGGNFAVHGTLEISGGEVKGGSGNATNMAFSSANIYVNGSNTYPDAFLKISGGSIDGGISVVTGTETEDNKPTVELSGAPQISNNGNGLNLGKSAGASKPIQIVGALSDTDGNKASVAVNLGNSQNTGVFATAAEGVTLTYGDKACFTSDSAAYQVAFYGDRLELVSTNALATCACAAADGNHADWCTQLDPVAWTGTGLPTEGTYYLTAPVEVSAPTEVTGKLNLWLQGNDITVSDEYVPDAELKNEYVFYVDQTGALTLLDTAEEAGTIYASDSTYEIIRNAGTLVIDGVDLDASAITAGKAQGLAVYVGEEDHPNSLFLLKDGTITGGTTTGWGGAVYVAAGSTMKMSGGTITGGTAAYGGNIGTRGTVEITGGSVTNGRYTGSSSRGGNLYASSLDESIASISVSGATISGGYTDATKKALTDRANICCWNANLSLTDVEIEGGIFMAGTGYTTTLSGVVKIAGGDKLAMSVSTTVKDQTIATVKADALAAGSSVNIVVHAWANSVGNVYVTGLAKALVEDTEDPVFTCVTNGYQLQPVLEDNSETYKLVLAK